MKTTIKKQWLALHASGSTAADAAEAMGMAKATAYAVAKELGITWAPVPRGPKRGLHWRMAEKIAEAAKKRPRGRPAGPDVVPLTLRVSPVIAARIRAAAAARGTTLSAIVSEKFP